MPAVGKENNVLIYEGSNFLKQRLLLSTLTGKPVKIINIRSADIEPGLKEYEINLIRLFDKVTNGTTIELNKSGTSVFYRPGLLLGGSINHDCCLERGIGYYMDILLALGPFCKTPLNVTLRGITNSRESPSVDHIKGSAFPILKKFLVVDDGLEFKIIKRGLMPDGGGELIFRCPVRKNLKAIQFLHPGMVKRIRGTVYASKVSPTLANRTVEAAKGVMLKFLPDVYISTDQNRGKQSGNSPGFGINIIAETTEGAFYSTENITDQKQEGKGTSVPEDLGRQAAIKLLEEIYRGGCVDSTFQWLVVLFMALAQKDVSKYLTGPLSDYTVNFLQHLRDFFSLTFKLETFESDDTDDSLAGASKDGDSTRLVYTAKDNIITRSLLKLVSEANAMRGNDRHKTFMLSLCSVVSMAQLLYIMHYIYYLWCQALFLFLL